MTKTEYLEFVRGWKANYAALTQEIRDTKRARKAAANAGNYDEHNALNARRQGLRRVAHQCLVVRAEMKVKAQEAYLAEREQRDAA